jgi:uncharacterized protein YfaT (DUF1175 family)
VQAGSPWENGYIENFHGKLRGKALQWAAGPWIIRYASHGEGAYWAAEALAKHEGRWLSLDGLYTITPEALKILRANPGIPLPPKFSE